jgi:NLI interacting factor-like phosphatase
MGKSAGDTDCLAILDLDNSIIHAVPLNKDNEDLFSGRHNSVPDYLKYKDDFNYKDFENTYRIFERPYLQQFLDKLFKHYRVAVWTAAGISYANFIIKNFILTKPNRKLEFVMWSDHCDVSEERYNHPKKLKMLNFYEKKSVIFDDNEDVLDGQMRRAVDSKDFDVTKPGAKDDDFLLRAFDLFEKKFNKL